MTIVLVYTSVDKIKERLKTRFDEGGRLTPLNQIQTMERILLENLHCLLATTTHCINRLVVYDNNGKSPEMILDQGFSPPYTNVAKTISREATAFLENLKFRATVTDSEKKVENILCRQFI